MWASSVGSHVVSYSSSPNLTAMCVRLVMVNFNCQLDGTWIPWGVSMRNYLDWVGLWEYLRRIFLIGLTEVGSPTLNVSGTVLRTGPDGM